LGTDPGQPNPQESPHPLVQGNVEQDCLSAFHEAAHNKDRSDSLHTAGGGGIFADIHAGGRSTATQPNDANIAFFADRIWNWGPQYIIGQSLTPVSALTRGRPGIRRPRGGAPDGDSPCDDPAQTGQGRRGGPVVGDRAPTGSRPRRRQAPETTGRHARHAGPAIAELAPPGRNCLELGENPGKMERPWTG